MIALLAVEPDRDPRLLQWKFRHETTVIVARLLRNHPVLVDVQQLGLVSRETDIPPAVMDEISGRISQTLPILRFSDRRPA